MTESLNFLIGPLPFCVPYADPGQTGPGSHFPLEINSLQDLCRLIWQVKTWNLSVTNLSNEFQEFADYHLEIPNHARDNGSPIVATDVICDYGFLWAHPFSLEDQEGDFFNFELRIEGFNTARRSASGGRYFPRFTVYLDMLFPPGSPISRENIASTLDGPGIAGTLDLDDSPAPLYSNYPGQLFESWSANVTLMPATFWEYPAAP